MKFRHEVKHEISLSDYYVLRQRLGAVAKPDIHGENGSYRVRSLYFDDAYDTALKEKINGLCQKVYAVLDIKDAQKILKGDIHWMLDSETALLRELYEKITTKGLRPKKIVEYHRDAFVFPAGNVRITLDYDIRTELCCVDFFNEESVTIPVWDNPIILEVKWDEFLPGIIRDVVTLEGRKNTAYSKYAAGRIYG